MNVADTDSALGHNGSNLFVGIVHVPVSNEPVAFPALHVCVVLVTPVPPESLIDRVRPIV